jgi:transcriptional regulator with XRE-family HTH domain
MKLLFTIDGLRRKIAADPEDEPSAGGLEGRSVDRALAAENTAVIGENKVIPLRIALGVLVRQLRLKESLSIAQLSERAEVSEDELRQVEHDPHYTARPRLIFQLSEFFGVSLVKLSQMSGTTHSVNRVLYNRAVQFAAYSDDVSTLTDEERAALEAFVAMLNEQPGV